MKENETEPACEGHNWELAQIHPNYWHGNGTVINEEIAVVICSFCGIVRKTIVKKLMTPKDTVEGWRERFQEQFVEMSTFYARDMHNRPPLYDTKTEDVEAIKSFIQTELDLTLTKEREATKRNIPYLRQWLNERTSTDLITNEQLEYWLYEAMGRSDAQKRITEEKYT